MSEREERAAQEIISNIREVPAAGQEYVRGYLQGQIDRLKAERERQEAERAS